MAIALSKVGMIRTQDAPKSCFLEFSKRYKVDFESHVKYWKRQETILQVDVGSAEEDYARDALFSRHPDMAEWPADHGFYFAKIELETIHVLDFFGGVNLVDLDDYYDASPY